MLESEGGAVVRKPGPVTDMFLSLVAAGHVVPVETMQNLRLPGELIHVPSYVSYSTPEVPTRVERQDNAKLGYNS
jgi:hypothetical protein